MGVSWIESSNASTISVWSLPNTDPSIAPFQNPTQRGHLTGSWEPSLQRKRVRPLCSELLLGVLLHGIRCHQPWPVCTYWALEPGSLHLGTHRFPAPQLLKHGCSGLCDHRRDIWEQGAPGHPGHCQGLGAGLSRSHSWGLGVTAVTMTLLPAQLSTGGRARLLNSPPIYHCAVIFPH